MVVLVTDDFAVRVLYAMLVSNFEREDILEHGEEIIEQLGYEFSVGNAMLVPY